MFLAGTFENNRWFFLLFNADLTSVEKEPIERTFRTLDNAFLSCFFFAVCEV